MLSQGLLLCILLLTIVGAADDIIQLKASEKLMAQFLAASIAIFATSPDTYLENCWTILWLVMMTNAVNLIDGMDGLAVSYATVIFGWSIYTDGPALVPCMLLGACLGFMPFNLYHAKYYLGDSGSHALGSAIGYLTVPFLSMHGATQVADLILVTFPIADILFVAFTRRIRRAGVTTGGTDHIAHRLARLIRANLVMPALIVTSIAFAVLAARARTVSPGLQVAFICVLWADMIFVMSMLERRTRRYFR